jgi:hypothetical protein
MIAALVGVTVLINFVCVVLLTAEKFVRRVTGEPSIEARLTSLEKRFVEASTRFSEKWGEIQDGIGNLEMTKVRQEEHFRFTDARLDELRADVNRIRDHQ